MRWASQLNDNNDIMQDNPIHSKIAQRKITRPYHTPFVYSESRDGITTLGNRC
ncbi:hypothetical protein [Rubritalea tangerina]|uniref:hypothetical protein n=1 Tax=Rubritalea tangerina TaxID=430798 RepID=UPI003621D8A3